MECGNSDTPGRIAEVCESLSRQKVDIYIVPEYKWMGYLAPNQVRIFKGKDCKFKSFVSAQESGLGGGTLLVKIWADKVVEVQCISERILLLKLIIRKAIFTFLLVYAPQIELPKAVKECLYDKLQHTVDKAPATK